MKQYPPQTSKHARGITLVITLVLLVLLSGIVVAFLSSVRTDLVASKTYEDSSSARLLADSAVNLVIGQIREASTQPKKAWISQPGLIRTYDASGEPVKAYKLYSAPSMVVDGTFDPAGDAASGKGDVPEHLPASSPDHWRKHPALWTDMNSPIMDSTSTPARGIYPIFDGNDLKKDASGAAIIDADGDGVTDIEGFRIEADLEDAASMPVRWLYMLKDGTVVPTEATSNSGEAKVLVPAGKEKDANGDPNPIVARVAFWTDDESSKINVNTASEGTFSDTPMCNSQPGVNAPWSSYITRPDTTFEWDLAERLGAQREYQRYPGHPATTCLSPVLWTPLAQAYKLDPTKLDERKELLELIYLLSPRVSGYQGALPFSSVGDLINTSNNQSSQGGTRRAGPQGVYTDATFKVTPDSDRLYAMIDELLFDPERGLNRFGTGATGSQMATSRKVLERTKFFLTAHSVAPEQNLWNQPRVAIWPIHVSNTRRTALDQLIAFCSTVGHGSEARPFYFTRQDPTSSTADLTARNKQIYDYLVRLTKGSIPGVKSSGTMASKYGADKDQILTEIFDYIRCTNLVDSSDYTKSYTPLGFTVPTTPAGIASTNVVNTSRGQVVPIEMSNGTRGLGRIPTISELAVVVISKGAPPATVPDATKKTRLEFTLIPQLFSPMAGYSAMGNNLRIEFSDPNFNVTGPTLLPTDTSGVPSGPAKTYANPFETPIAGQPGQPQPKLYDRGRISNVRDADSKIGGHIGSRSLLDNATEGDVPPAYVSAGAPTDSVPPSGEIDVDGYSDNRPPQGARAASSAPKLTLTGTVNVKIFAPYTGTAPIQTFTFTFPPTKFPLPNRVISTGSPAKVAEIAEYSGAWKRGGRFAAAASQDPFLTTRSTTSTSYDVIRSVVPATTFAGRDPIQGDMRIVAATKDAGNLFGPVAAYSQATAENIPGIHSFRQSWRLVSPGADFGSLVSLPALAVNATETAVKSAYAVNLTNDIKAIQDTRPPIPEGVNGVINSLGRPGDWDNGPAQVFDGPLCNKADEGTDRHHHVSSNFGSDTLYKEAAPYIGSWYEGEDAGLGYSSFFSPNRQVPSAVMFGSLPTGVKRKLPWQTLLFRPAKSYFPGGVNHPGGSQAGPPDHLLLDLFWMPVVEPYAISEPFATAGKINLNYQIAPFTYIKRDTGLRAVLKSVKMGALNPAQKTVNNNNFIVDHKIVGTMGATAGATDGDYQQGGGRGVVVRRDIDLDNTLKQVEDRFKKAAGSSGNRPFISASEICEIPLIPKDVPMVPGLPMKAHVSANFKADTALSEFDNLLTRFWGQHMLTGDNTLERPYAHIYPRLTTRSNTYTVHVRVQTLKKVPSGDKYIFKEGRDPVTGEFRGSFLVQRFLDSNSANFVDPNGKSSNDSDPDAVLGPYRFRVISSKQFAP